MAKKMSKILMTVVLVLVLLIAVVSLGIKFTAEVWSKQASRRSAPKSLKFRSAGQCQSVDAAGQTGNEKS